MPTTAGKAANCMIESPIDDSDETRPGASAPVTGNRPADDDSETKLSSPAPAALNGISGNGETRLSTPAPVVVAGKPADDDAETKLSSPNTASTDNADDVKTHMDVPSANDHSTPVSDSEGPQQKTLTTLGTVAGQTGQELPAGGVHLPIGFMLRDYKITELLGQGGFGVTYLAQDTIFDSEVVIKENLPTTIATRNTTTFCVQPLTGGTGPGSYEWALNNFLNEAKILRKLKHPNIIEIITAFREMGTAYYVMPYISGTSLDKTLDKTSMPMPEAEIRSLLVTLLGALEYLHSLKPILLHRDIKPANILRKPDGSPILIDFGTARILTEHSQTSIESPGYTPIEQLQTHGNLGPWTDIYALGATMYHLITGTKPMKVNDRMGRRDVLVPLAGRPELQKDYSPQLLLSVDKAMALWPEDRWQNAAEWKQALNTAPKAAPEVNAEPTPQSEPQTTPEVKKEKPAGEEGKQTASKTHAETKAPDQATIAPKSTEKASSEKQQEEPKTEKKAATVQDQEKANAALLQAAEEDNTALIRAACLGKTEVVRQLLDRGADIEAKDKNGETALIRAAWVGETKVVRLLLDRGADIEAKDKDGETALIWAACLGEAEVVRLLLDRGANIEAKGRHGYTALMVSAINGRIGIIKILLAAGANMGAKNENGETALILAERKGQDQVSDLLRVTGVRYSADLRHAAKVGDVALVSRLLDKGSDIESMDNTGETALSWAAKQGQTEVVKLLLDRGADIEAKNEDGYTALILSSKSEVVKLLLDRGANIEAKDKDGETASSKAVQWNRQEVIPLLKEACEQRVKSTFSPDAAEELRNLRTYLGTRNSLELLKFYMIYLLVAIFIFRGEKALAYQVLPAVCCFVRQCDKMPGDGPWHLKGRKLFSAFITLCVLLMGAYGLILIVHDCGSMTHVAYTTEYIIWLSICITVSCRCWSLHHEYGPALSWLSGSMALIGIVGLCLLSPFETHLANGQSAMFNLCTLVCLLNVIPSLWGLIVSPRLTFERYHGILTSAIIFLYLAAWLLIG